MGEGSLPALREMLNGSSGTESMRAAWAMGRLGPASKNAVPDLLQVMRERGNTGLQIEALNSLSHVGILPADNPHADAKALNVAFWYEMSRFGIRFMSNQIVICGYSNRKQTDYSQLVMCPERKHCL
jgi:hypothetical protein